MKKRVILFCFIFLGILLFVSCGFEKKYKEIEYLDYISDFGIIDIGNEKYTIEIVNSKNEADELSTVKEKNIIDLKDNKYQNTTINYKNKNKDSKYVINSFIKNNMMTIYTNDDGVKKIKSINKKMPKDINDTLIEYSKNKLLTLEEIINDLTIRKMNENTNYKFYKSGNNDDYNLTIEEKNDEFIKKTKIEIRNNCLYSISRNVKASSYIENLKIEISYKTKFNDFIENEYIDYI